MIMNQYESYRLGFFYSPITYMHTREVVGNGTIQCLGVVVVFFFFFFFLQNKKKYE